jgi:hypothetical protein
VKIKSRAAQTNSEKKHLQENRTRNLGGESGRPGFGQKGTEKNPEPTATFRKRRI